METKKNEKQFYNVIQLMQRFNTPEVCEAHLASIRWLEGAVCPHCGSKKVYQRKDSYKSCAPTRLARRTSRSIPAPFSPTRKSPMIIWRNH
jgi:DNA-directed RNA polymerase subunit RPC12/RpoP